MKYTPLRAKEKVATNILLLLSAAAVAKPKTMGRPKKNSKVKEVYESNIDYAIIVNGDNLNYIVNILTERHKKNIRNYKVAIDKQEEIANINFMIESGLKLSKKKRPQNKTCGLVETRQPLSQCTCSGLDASRDGGTGR